MLSPSLCHLKVLCSNGNGNNNNFTIPSNSGSVVGPPLQKYLVSSSPHLMTKIEEDTNCRIWSNEHMSKNVDNHTYNPARLQLQFNRNTCLEFS